MQNVVSEHRRKWTSRIILAVGLAVWMGVQGYLVLAPLWQRSLPPEPDDVLPYIVRTAKLTECWGSQCQGLKDIKAQVSPFSKEPEIRAYQIWAATPLGMPRPLFSAALIGVNQFTGNYFTAYRIVASLSPLLFGAAFVYLLTVLWGPRAAGIGLILLAFKVFPDSGLYFFVPSNMAMGLAVVLWARVISRKGAAPIAVTLGSVLVIATHPLGVAYAMIGCIIALILRGYTLRGKVSARAALLMVGLLAVIVAMAFLVGLYQYLWPMSPLALLSQGAASVMEVIRKIVLLKDGLIGSPPLFLVALGLGFLTISAQDRATIFKVLLVTGLFLAATLFYPPRQPGDIFFRMWIPVMVILYGAIGQALCWTFTETRTLLRAGLPHGASLGQVRVANYWPILAFLLVLGHCVQISVTGSEQVIVMADHFRKRQPIAVCDFQVKVLESQAKSKERVLYTSMMVMPYYFVNGAMKLGAVYYHPVLNDLLKDWLARPDLRFAVTFNPLMYHPAFEGLHERRWGTASPSFYFSPLNKGARHYSPVLEEDSVPVADYKWIDVEPRGQTPPRVLRLLIRNPGQGHIMHIIPLNAAGQPLHDRQITTPIQSAGDENLRMEYEDLTNFGARFDPRGSGETIIDVDLQKLLPSKRYRIVFAGWDPKVRLAGIRFDESKLNWPWDQKARVTFMHKSWKVGELTFTFDPSPLLPAPLSSKPLTVLNDCGSTVLLKIDQ